MLAAGHVNVHYLLILLLPAVLACVMLALTWYSRAKRRRIEADEQEHRAPGAKRRRNSAAVRERRGRELRR